MQDGPRILVAAALAKIIEPLVRQSFGDALVRIAEDQGAVEEAVHGRLRFDVVVADLTWNDYAVEYSPRRATGSNVITWTRPSSSRRWSASTGRRPGPGR
jgi:hypothetical protein